MKESLSGDDRERRHIDQASSGFALAPLQHSTIAAIWQIGTKRWTWRWFFICATCSWSAWVGDQHLSAVSIPRIYVVADRSSCKDFSADSSSGTFWTDSLTLAWECSTDDWWLIRQQLKDARSFLSVTGGNDESSTHMWGTKSFLWWACKIY